MGYLRRCLQVVRGTDVNAYHAEVRNANWTSVFIGIGIVIAANIIGGLIASAMPAPDVSSFGGLEGFEQFDDFQTLAAQQRNPGSAFSAIIWVPLAFFLGAGALYMWSRAFGGRGQSFMLHSYLLSLSYTPLRGIAALISWIPCIGPLASLVLLIYQLYHASLSMQVSQGMDAGRARTAVLVNSLLIFFLGCLCAVVAGAALAAMIATVVNTSTP
jgi:hypothetical protein